EDHVGGVNRLPAADRAAVEEVAVLERAHFELRDRHRRVLPDAEQVDELEVDHLRAVFLCKLQDLSWSHGRSPIAWCCCWVTRIGSVCGRRARARLLRARRCGCGWLLRRA